MLLKKVYIILRTKILKIKYLILLTQLLILPLNTKINQVKNEIPSIANLATTAALNPKISEAKNIIPNISNLATTRDVKPFCELDIKNFTLFSYESP